MMISKCLEVTLMSSTWGDRIKISIFGESHGPAIGVVIDGLPAGEKIDMEELRFQMSRRAPGRGPASTKRCEPDEPEFISGLLDGVTDGSPLCAVIKNLDTHSADYSGLDRVPRPGHADYPAGVRFARHNDYRGGGHFSGRLTAPLVAAGAVCRQILARRGVTVGAHLYSCAGISDTPLDTVNCPPQLLESLAHAPLPVLDVSRGEKMLAAVEAARGVGDSVGGIVECAAVGLPAGLGGPFAGGESLVSSLLFAIPGVKGVEFGAGFGAAGLKGSEDNDPFAVIDGRVTTQTNNHGGLLGGITTGMPLIVRAAFKPTPSIALPQHSVDLDTLTPAELRVKGRHDPCIAVRAVPVVESAVCVSVLELFMEAYGYGLK
jgi:chorismate synthase